MASMRMRKGTIIGLGVLVLVFAGCQPQPPSTMTLVCNWGVGPLAPTVWPNSTQVMMMPTVMNLGHPGGLAQVAFVSFENVNNVAGDENGVLRVINLSGNEIARFPDPSNPVAVPPSCTAYPNLNTDPPLSPLSGLALGKLDASSPVDIIAVLDDHATNQGGIIAFRLVGGTLIPQWCSQPLPAGDSIPRASAPAIAQLDPPGKPASIIVDNKVYDALGNLRYTGFSSSGGNCATCPRSRTAVVANLSGGTSLPQVITGGGIYQSTSTLVWTGPSSGPPILIPSVLGLAYPAVADLDLDLNPEIVVTDAQATTLRVFSATGTQLTSITLPNPGYTSCGGPPMIGDADGIPGPEIGVASCSRYTLFKYSAGTLTQLWSVPIDDPSGQTTSTLFNAPSGTARIYYADSMTLWVFDGTNGTVLQSLPNSSGTAIEGPVIASFDTGPPGSNSPQGQGHLILSGNNYGGGLQTGVRIFKDPAIGPARCVWPAHSYRQTDVKNCFGDIPVVEPPSWLPPSRNTYRVQQQ